MDEKKLIILVQEHECLYILQHKHYDNNLVKYNSWKEITGELHAQDKQLSRRTQHCRRMAGEWQGRGRVVAGSWQGRGRVVAGSWQGNGMVCVNRPSLVHSITVYIPSIIKIQAVSHSQNISFEPKTTFLYFMYRMLVYRYITNGTNTSIRRSLKFVYTSSSSLTKITALFSLQHNKQSK
jgi:hypothetical protein